MVGTLASQLDYSLISRLFRLAVLWVRMCTACTFHVLMIGIRSVMAVAQCANIVSFYVRISNFEFAAPYAKF